MVTGRPSVLWHEATRKVNLTDFCEDALEETGSTVAAIMDPRAEWQHQVASAMLVLGLSCTESGRKGVARRPSVGMCINTVSGMTELPLLPPPPALMKECVVCLETVRGRHRFLPWCAAQ